MAKKKQKVENLPTKVSQSNTRPPVVAVLGHVDHGKTSLLDYIRKAHVTSKEAGGITQHIGAYQINHRGRTITFIDTPGHEAFSAMRARGGAASDLAILVVAADDGVMPQTKESIAHIKAANIPFIVAINKIDVAGSNLEKVKKQLAEQNILVEGYGGDVVAVPVSAKTGQGVDDLLEIINLISDMQELPSEKGEEFSGLVIESRLDKFKGSVATVLVKKGILKVGDDLYTNSSSGKVKSLMDADGKQTKEASPSTPVEILGFSKVPKVGERVNSKKESLVVKQTEITQKTPVKLGLPEKNEIRLIIKADVSGSLEAIENSIEGLRKDDQKVKIFYADTGNISDGDILLAAATKSLIIGFNVSINSAAEKLAAEEKVLIRKFNIIYELLDELKEGLEALSVVEPKEETLGQADIRQVFKAAEGKIAGCKVMSGRINKSDNVVVKRENKIIGRSKIASMKHRESDINEATEGQEFGLLLEKEVPFTKGDIIVAIGSTETK